MSNEITDLGMTIFTNQQCICLIDMLIYILCKFKVQLEKGELTVFQEQSDVFTKLEEDIENLEECDHISLSMHNVILFCLVRSLLNHIRSYVYVSMQEYTT